MNIDTKYELWHLKKKIGVISDKLRKIHRQNDTNKSDCILIEEAYDNIEKSITSLNKLL